MIATKVLFLAIAKINITLSTRLSTRVVDKPKNFNFLAKLIIFISSTLISGTLLALSDDDIVESSVLEQTYLRGGFVSSDGLIKELKHHLQGTTLSYCKPVVVRAKPSLLAAKITSVNDGNFKQFRFVLSSHYGWTEVFKDDQFVGYSAQALKQQGSIKEIVCRTPNYYTNSVIDLDGTMFNAELVDQQLFSVKNKNDEEIYSHNVSAKTSLYELYADDGLFGWLVGWNRYDGSGLSNGLDFTVARVIVPYLNLNKEVKVWEALYFGIINSRFKALSHNRTGGISIVVGKRISGPRFYGCTACSRLWGQPVFINIDRNESGISERVLNGELNFARVQSLSSADRFLYNWIYWNPSQLNELLSGEIKEQILKIEASCAPQKFTWHDRLSIPEWEWTSRIHDTLENPYKTNAVIENQDGRGLFASVFETYARDANNSYDNLLNYIWKSPEYTPTNPTYPSSDLVRMHGREYFYTLKDCSPPEAYDLVTNIVGYLNLPLDIDLIRSVISNYRSTH